MARRDLAERIARQIVARERWASLFEHDLVAHGLDQLEKQLQRGPVDSEPAFLRRVMHRRMLTAARMRRTEAKRFDRLALDVRRVKVSKQKGAAGSDLAENGLPFGGLSLQFIENEEQEMMSLQAAMAAACLPDEEDRSLLRDRFFDPSDLTLAELGALHGGKTAQGMANHLRRFFGSGDQPGAVEPAVVMVGRLPLPLARAYVRVMEEFDDLDVMSDPFAAAVGHLEFAGRFSKAHRAYAVEGTARLQWLARHQPSNRGLPNKVLRRLALAACFYVVKQDDAAHDQWNPRGLADDVRILKGVQTVLGEYAPKP